MTTKRKPAKAVEAKVVEPKTAAKIIKEFKTDDEVPGAEGDCPDPPHDEYARQKGSKSEAQIDRIIRDSLDELGVRPDLWMSDVIKFRALLDPSNEVRGSLPALGSGKPN